MILNFEELLFPLYCRHLVGCCNCTRTVWNFKFFARVLACVLSYNFPVPETKRKREKTNKKKVILNFDELLFPLYCMHLVGWCNCTRTVQHFKNFARVLACILSYDFPVPETKRKREKTNKKKVILNFQELAVFPS